MIKLFTVLIFKFFLRNFLAIRGAVHRVGDPKLFLKNPNPDPIFLWVLDPDPTWPAKSSGSSAGSDYKYSLFHNANDVEAFFIAF
jgi:hypothetical protein